MEIIFNLQQSVLDGLEYLKENQRGLPIWGIPPFETTRFNFHPDDSASKTNRDFIGYGMDLVERDLIP